MHFSIYKVFLSISCISCLFRIGYSRLDMLCPPGATHHKRGQLFNSNFRLYFCNDEGQPISPWHDIPLYASESTKDKPLLNFIVEIPRHKHAKMEINKFQPLNPIMQDLWDNGEPRFVSNLWPYRGYLWNYGALPQTFEDPTYECPRTATVGDFDPVDVIEIGKTIWPIGSVIKVKPIAILPLIDQRESDWKVIVIHHKDPKAHLLNDLSDIEKHMPGLINDTIRWFSFYKVPAGKKPNSIGLNGYAADFNLTMTIIGEVNTAWKHLMGNVDRCNSFGIICNHTLSADKNLNHLTTFSEAISSIAGPAAVAVNARKPDNIDEYHFVNDKSILN